MATRYAVNPRKDKRIFTKTAMQTQSANAGSNPMRGGYRF